MNINLHRRFHIPDNRFVLPSIRGLAGGDPSSTVRVVAGLHVSHLVESRAWTGEGAATFILLVRHPAAAVLAQTVDHFLAHA